MRRPPPSAFGFLLALTLGALALWGLVASDPPAPRGVRAALQVSELLGSADTVGYARAFEPRPFEFPADHGPHPEFRTEWWYLTGNLSVPAGAEGGRRFGFQLTFFRSALASGVADRASAWATNQVYMAHFALVDAAGRRFHAFDRFSRAALGLAGARAEPFEVWLEDWRMESLGESLFPLRLRAAEGPVAIDLTLAGGKPAVLQGDEGLSRKSAEPGNASYYYSFTRLPATGTVRVGNRDLAVEGLAWMDREWSTSALSENLVGWDWFALQLADGRDLMLYQLRGRDGRPSPYSAGVVVERDGSALHFGRDGFGLEVLDRWRSPLDGTAYPARWRLRVPAAALELEVTPVLPDQELDLAVRYWEGAVDVRGRGPAEGLGGHGYVELTGYAADAGGARVTAPE